MTVFADTSALYALLDRDDANHRRAAAQLKRLRGDALVTHNYVVVETAALVHRRLGPAASRALFEDVLPIVEILWVDEPLHRAAVSAFLAAVRRRTSFVDRVTFEMMRRDGLETAFAFDADFRVEGFRTAP